MYIIKCCGVIGLLAQESLRKNKDVIISLPIVEIALVRYAYPDLLFEEAISDIIRQKCFLGTSQESSP